MTFQTILELLIIILTIISAVLGSWALSEKRTRKQAEQRIAALEKRNSEEVRGWQKEHEAIVRLNKFCDFSEALQERLMELNLFAIIKATIFRLPTIYIERPHNCRAKLIIEFDIIKQRATVRKDNYEIVEIINLISPEDKGEFSQAIEKIIELAKA